MDGSHCPGWTEAEAGTANLISHLNWAADAVLRGYLPDGLRLECHPSAPYALMRMVIPGYAVFVSGAEPWKPQFPVVVSAEMKPGQWRLVIADGEIHDGS
jgi:hypothetical protein